MKATDQFNELRTPSGKKAFDAHVAVYANGGVHVIIGAPTLAALATEYERFTGQQLIKERAQHVWIVMAERGS